MLAAAFWPAGSAAAAPLCYAIADSDKTTSSDELIAVDPAAGTSFPVGSLGALDVEAAAFSLDGRTLLAADGGQLGRVDLASAAFTPLAAPFGTAGGTAGEVALGDVDSLAFDPGSGRLYGVHRTAGVGTPDLLFQIDPATGAHVPEAFGTGADYLQIPLLLGLESIDDIAIHPLDGRIFAIANEDPGGYGDRLVRIDTAGAISDVGPLGAIDVEGLGFDSAGNLYASTGADGTFAGRDRLYSVELASGAASLIAPLPSLAEDYEALACPILFDLGDAPEPAYPTTLEAGAARHALAGTLLLGSAVDAEADGRASADALGDDGDGADDEDGVTFASVPSQGAVATLEILASEPGLLDAWIDFDGDGDWTGAGDQIFDSLPLAGGGNSLTFSIPADAALGPTFSRFRLSTAGDLGPGGPAADGEVEDYRLILIETDSDGDGAPDSNEQDDRDDDGIPDSMDYDPTGYFFDEETGEILTGGFITVSGPGAINLIEDGSSGFYQFFTDGTPGTYTVSVVPPFGYEPSDTCLPSDPPPFDPTGGPDPTVLGYDEVGSSGFLASTECTSFYLTFELEAGDPAIFFNNLPMQPVPICYSVADSDKTSSSDELVAIEPGSGRVTTFGPLGTLDVEAAVLAPGGILYAADGGTLGTVDPASGAFTAAAAPFGTASGSAGSLPLDDVDGLTIDPTTGILYGVHRTSGADTPDLLFQVDPASGAFVADAFGPGADYLELPPISGLESIDDLAVSPTTGRIYAVANDDPSGFGDRLVTVDKETGAVAEVGPLGVVDVEGLSFDRAGNLYASTGADAGAADRDAIYLVDPATGAATPGGALLGLFEDYEALACQSLERPAALGNRVWLDEDNDGRQGPGESGLGGVAVELYAAGLVPGVDPPTARTTTDALGGYLFAGLAPAAYLVRVDPASLAPGLVQTTHPVLPGADYGNQSQAYGARAIASENPTADFGYNVNPGPDVDGNTGTAALGDRVWADADGDGVADATEVGVPGVDVELLGPGPDGLFGTGNEVVLATAATDAAGRYLFDALAPGAYAVRVATASLGPGGPLAGYAQSGDPDHFGTAAGANDHRTTTPVLLGPGDVFLNADFGYLPPDSQANSVGDTVFLDADGDGLQGPGEPGLAGVSVALVADDGDGLFDPASPGLDRIVATTATVAGGGYFFTGLPDGDYAVWVNDTENVLAPLVQSADPDAVVDRISAVSLDPGSTSAAAVVDRDQDFGFTASGQGPADGAIGDTVFLDADSDGLPGPGEGLEGVTVALLDAAGLRIAVAVTDEHGRYLFGDLDPAATYTVTVETATLPPGLANTADPDGGGDSLSLTDLAATGPVDLGQDFGYRPAGVAGTIGDTVFLDSDADGLFAGAAGPDLVPGTDDDEPGLAGVTVDLYLDLDADGLLDANEPRVATTETDPQGLYLFQGLPVEAAGGGGISYLVVLSDRAGRLAGTWQTSGPAAGDGVSDGNSQARPYALELTAASPDHLLADFGYSLEAAALGNRVWNDLDTDGLQDPGEPGIEGVRVSLEITYPDGSIATASTLTADDGSYRFAGLLLDEDYDGSGPAGPGGEEPRFLLSATPPPGATTTLLDVAGNSRDREDSDDPAGVLARAFRGATDTALLTDPNNEAVQASYDFGFVALDFGDAPDPSYPTLLASDGARHALRSSLFLGGSIDVESDGQPSAAAGGDDAAGDDEDGVLFPAALVIGDSAARVEVTATASGLLDAWIDFDTDGSWLGPGEQIFTGQPVTGGANSLTFAIPPGAAAGSTFARFRLSSGGGLAPTGQAADGEVEDYALTLVEPAMLGDFVWHDWSEDGIRHPGEPPLEGVTVELLDPGGALVATTVTDADGLYGFTVAPGSYLLRFTPPVGYSLSPRDQGGDDTLDSDPDPGSGETGLVTVGAGESDETIDAGMISPQTEAVVPHLRAWTEGSGVVVEWRSTSEIGTIGFYLYRLAQDSGTWEPVREELLAAPEFSPAGGTYRVLDPVAAPGEAATYLLAEVESGGRILTHGPFPVEVGSALPGDPNPPDPFDRRPADPSEAYVDRLQARRWELRAHQEARGGMQGSELEITVLEEGLYFLSAEEIAEKLDQPVQAVRHWIEQAGLALENRGLEVAWLPDESGAGLYFFGEAVDTLYTRRNVYRLRQGRGLRMRTADGGAPPPAPPGQSFERVIDFEEDLLPNTQLPLGPRDDYWFWALVRAGNPTQGRQSFSFTAYDPDGSAAEATLEIRLHGVSASGHASEHRAAVSLNGQWLGETSWQGLEPATLELVFDPALLLPGVNELEVSGRLGPGIPFSLFYVDGFELRYPSLYRARGGRLRLHAAGHRVLTVGGFAGGEVRILGLEDPRTPVLIQGLGHSGPDPDSGEHRVSFVPTGSGSEYLAVSEDALLSPAGVRADLPSDLLAPGQGAEYLIVAAPELVEAAETLAEHRRAQGLHARVVDLEDVMDEFAHGLFDPEAIRDFLAYAREHWNPSPRWVVLAGNGGFDYRDLLGAGDNLVPTLMARTREGLFASDGLFADLEGDDRLPEIAIGRLPVLTAEELRAYTAKLAAAEALSSRRRRALVLSDQPDAAGDFTADGRRLAEALSAGFLPRRIALAEEPLAAARGRLFEGLRKGSGLVAYLGHGGLDRMADEGLLTTEDVPLLTTSEPTVVAGLTCAINRFDIPGFPSLGGELVTSPAGGALASWAPTGLSSHPQALALGLELAAALASGHTLGEAALQALERLEREGGSRDMLSIYNLLGDPAIRLEAGSHGTR